MEHIETKKSLKSQLKIDSICSIRNWSQLKIINMIKDSLRQKRHTRHQPLFYFPYANRQKNSHSKTRKDQIVIYQIKPDLIEATGPLFSRTNFN